MKTITVRGLPARVLRALEARARANGRSVNREVVLCLERSLVVPPFDPVDFLARVDRLRAKIRVRGLTEARLRRDKRRGRP